MTSSRPLGRRDLNSAGGKGNLRGLKDILLPDLKLLIAIFCAPLNSKPLQPDFIYHEF